MAVALAAVTLTEGKVKAQPAQSNSPTSPDRESDETMTAREIHIKLCSVVSGGLVVRPWVESAERRRDDPTSSWQRCPFEDLSPAVLRTAGR
jgi:hypothetical protein